MALVLFASCCALSACAATQLGRGERAFRRVTTEHFTLYTDLSERVALRTARGYERWLSAFMQHGWEVRGKLPFRLNVVVFRNPDELHRYARDDIAGYHVGDLMLEPWIIMGHDHRDGAALTLFRHELTHYIAGLSFYRQPTWFSEGLATYFETAHFVGRDKFAVGSLPKAHAQWLVARGPVSVPKLFKGDVDRYSHAFYASSWLVVHYLMSLHPDAFVLYQDGLARGLAHDEAWHAAFPQLSAEELDARVRSYLLSDELASYALEVRAEEGAAHSELLTLADEHALAGLLWASRCDGCAPGQQRKRMLESMQAALRADPAQPQAVASQLLSRYGAAPSRVQVARAEELVRAHPEDWLSWVVLGYVAHGTPEFARILAAYDPVAKLEGLVPHYPHTRYLRALQLQAEGKRELALGEVRRARRSASRNWQLLFIEAQLLAELGACADLGATLEQLQQIAHGAPLPRAQAQVLEELAQQCATVELAHRGR